MMTNLIAATEKYHRWILYVLSVGVMVIGVVIMGPWYGENPLTAFGNIVLHPWSRFGAGLFYVASGGMAFIGLKYNQVKMRHMGAFGVFLALVFMLLLRVLSFGIHLPMQWLPLLLLSVIASLTYLVERIE